MTIEDAADPLATLRAQALICMRCRLAQSRHQVVCGEGNPHARIMLIGQGPSEIDDQTGHPYSGPSGPLLDRALAAAGLSRGELWLTNITKCIAWAEEGRPRKSREPRADESRACRVWLDQEIALVQPKVIVCLGGPAAKAVIASKFKLTQQHGRVFAGPGGLAALATYQPTYVLRLREHDEAAALRAWNELVADLRKAAELAKAS